MLNKSNEWDAASNLRPDNGHYVNQKERKGHLVNQIQNTGKKLVQSMNLGFKMKQMIILLLLIYLPIRVNRMVQLNRFI